MVLKNRKLQITAAIGLILACTVAAQSGKKTPPAEPLAQPAQAPFASYIGGAGMIEASTENISIGSSLPGTVQKLFVKVGDQVRQGDPLFQIDDRDYRAELLVRQANLIKSRAAVEEARASLEDYRSQYALVRDAKDGRAVSVDDVQKRRNAEAVARAKLESAKAQVLVDEAQLKSTETNLERLTVRAPVDCKVMKINIRLGEYAQTGVLESPLMLLGNLDRLHVRVDIDENDAWRFKPETKAIAFMRGNRDLKTDLRFEYVEPYVTPKTSLTGSSTERVDTRVLQVIYSFDAKALPAYVGQQMDIFIETPELQSAAAQGGKT